MLAEVFDSLPVEEVSSMMGEVRVKEYPVFEIQRGILCRKKVRYHNYEQEDIHIRFECDKPEFCTVNDKTLNILATGVDFLRLRILVPNNFKEKYLEVSILAYENESQKLIQRNVFKLNLVD